MSENVYASNAIAAKTIDTLEPTAVYLRHTQTAQVLTTAVNAIQSSIMRIMQGQL